MSTKDREINAKSRTQISVFNQDKNKKVTFLLQKLPKIKNRLTQVVISVFVFFSNFASKVERTAGLNRLTQIVGLKGLVNRCFKPTHPNRKVYKYFLSIYPAALEMEIDNAKN